MSDACPGSSDRISSSTRFIRSGCSFARVTGNERRLCLWFWGTCCNARCSAAAGTSDNKVDPLADIETIETELILKDLETVQKRTGDDPVKVLKRAIDNIRPSVEVRSRRVGGSSYQVPVEVRPRRAQTLAVRWLVEFARKRKENTMALRLANEILDASNRTGAAVKRREDVHKMAESNKAFAHYRW